MKNFEIKRREFIRNLGLSLLAVPFLTNFKEVFAARTKDKTPAAKPAPLPAGMTAVAESDPIAAAIGYKANQKDIDKKKYPQWKTGQSCKNCALYTATEGNASWGKCQMMVTGLVSSAGWCGSYSKKP